VKTAAVAALDPRVAVVPGGPEELDDADEEEPATPMVTPLLLLLSGGRIPCILALCRFKKYLLQNSFWQRSQYTSGLMIPGGIQATLTLALAAAGRSVDDLDPPR